MKRLILSVVVIMFAHSFLNGQTLEITSFPILDKSQGMFIDWGSYTAEKLDTSAYVVTYDSSAMVDTLLRENYFSKNILLIGHNVNKFLPKNKLTYDLVRTKGGVNYQVCENQHHVFFYEAIYSDRRTGQTITTERLCQDDFIVTEDTPTQLWSLKDEKRIIGEYECSLAECDFRGRHYYAWYAEDIPLPYGPWKLGGLPGLIVSAYDTDHQYEYSMTEITPESIPIFKINYEYVNTDRIKLNKLINELLHKPVIYYSNHLHRGGFRMPARRLAEERDIVYQYDAIERD